jgi:hypothetical protein
MKGTKYIPKDDDLIKVIDFVTWLRLECDFNSIYLWDYKGKDLTLEELFKIYIKKYGK